MLRHSFSDDTVRSGHAGVGSLSAHVLETAPCFVLLDFRCSVWTAPPCPAQKLTLQFASWFDSKPVKLIVPYFRSRAATTRRSIDSLHPETTRFCGCPAGTFGEQVSARLRQERARAGRDGGANARVAVGFAAWRRRGARTDGRAQRVDAAAPAGTRHKANDPSSA